MRFLQFALVRDPVKRPTLDDLITRLRQLQVEFSVPLLKPHHDISISQTPPDVQNLQPSQMEELLADKPNVILECANTRSETKTSWGARISDFLLCRCHSCLKSP